MTIAHKKYFCTDPDGSSGQLWACGLGVPDPLLYVAAEETSINRVKHWTNCRSEKIRMDDLGATVSPLVKDCNYGAQTIALVLD